jgi:hypothetical protein
MELSKIGLRSLLSPFPHFQVIKFASLHQLKILKKIQKKKSYKTMFALGLTSTLW